MWCVLLLLLHSAMLLYGMNTTDEQRIEASQSIPESAIDPRKDVVQRKIVHFHNFFRTEVLPTATNMLKMSWHDGAAKQAQAFAEECKFLEHSNTTERKDSKLGFCGQNLYVSDKRNSWFRVINDWFLEFKDFTYGSDIGSAKVGHYTQMVWSTTHKVGCGMANCKGGLWGNFYNYVCNYCPAGNIGNIQEFPYKPGPPCEDCPKHCIAGALCSNTCNYIDHYNNCKDIFSNGKICTTGFCNATCNCGESTLHRNHPW